MKRSFGVIGSPELSNAIQGESWKRQKQLTRAASRRRVLAYQNNELHQSSMDSSWLVSTCKI